ncbi:MAG: cohesin domain-containing protein, partial [Chloroflexota bacterium]
MAVALVGALALAARPMPAHADAALVLVWPDVLVLQVGQESEVEVLIEDVTALYGVDCRLEFDRDLFEVLDADAQTQGVQVTAGSYPHPDMVVRNEANNTAGTVWYAATQLNPREPAAGSGTVFRMRVRGKAPGSGTIHISYLKLVDRTPVELERELSDGDVTVSAQGGSSSTVPPPTATRTPTATPTSTQTPVPTATTAPGQPTSTPAPSVTPPPTAPPSATPWPAQATAAPTPTLASGYPVPDQPTAAATAPLASAATASPGGTPAATTS